MLAKVMAQMVWSLNSIIAFYLVMSARTKTPEELETERIGRMLPTRRKRCADAPPVPRRWLCPRR